jgi:hypothetical protein
VNRKKQLITDIENLLNNYDGVETTTINPTLLEFMDEETLIEIISNLLEQKEDNKEADRQWLDKFKTTVQ